MQKLEFYHFCKQNMIESMLPIPIILLSQIYVTASIEGTQLTFQLQFIRDAARIQLRCN